MSVGQITARLQQAKTELQAVPQVAAQAASALNEASALISSVLDEVSDKTLANDIANHGPAIVAAYQSTQAATRPLDETITRFRSAGPFGAPRSCRRRRFFVWNRLRQLPQLEPSGTGSQALPRVIGDKCDRAARQGLDRDRAVDDLVVSDRQSGVARRIKNQLNCEFSPRRLAALRHRRDRWPRKRRMSMPKSGVRCQLIAARIGVHSVLFDSRQALV